MDGAGCSASDLLPDLLVLVLALMQVAGLTYDRGQVVEGLVCLDVLVVLLFLAGLEYLRQGFDSEATQLLGLSTLVVAHREGLV